MDKPEYRIGEPIEYKTRSHGWIAGKYHGRNVNLRDEVTSLVIVTSDRRIIHKIPEHVRKAPPPYEPTEAELQAAFLAARGLGKVLDDEVLSAVLKAAHEAREGN